MFFLKSIMKSWVILVFVVLIFSGLISATYGCSEGDLLTDQKEIEVGNRKSINGINLGLIYSDETFAMGKYSAELLTDAKKFSLSDLSNSTELDLIDGEKTINLLNLSSSSAKIIIDGDSEDVEKESLTTIKSIFVFLTQMQGEYPGTGSIEGLAGKEKISLSNEAEEVITTLGGENYLLKLFVASDNNAIIIVGVCENTDANLVEIAEVNESETTPESEINDSNEQETEINDSFEQNDSDIGADNIKTKIFDSKTIIISAGVIISVMIVVLIVFLIILKKKKINPENKEEIQ